MYVNTNTHIQVYIYCINNLLRFFILSMGINSVFQHQNTSQVQIIRVLIVKQHLAVTKFHNLFE